MREKIQRRREGERGRKNGDRRKEAKRTREACKLVEEKRWQGK